MKLFKSFFSSPPPIVDMTPREALKNGKEDRIHKIFQEAIENSSQATSFDPNELLELIVEDILLHDGVHTNYSSSGLITFRGKEYPASFFLKKIDWQKVRLTEANAIQLKKKHYHDDGGFYFSDASNRLYKDLFEIEKQAIFTYTGMGYYEMNNLLRKGKADSDKEFKKNLLLSYAMASGINKIPETLTEQYIYRVMGDEKGKLFLADQMHTSYPVKGFYSTAKSRPTWDFGDGRVLLVIRNSHLAKDISGLSQFPDENECLILPGYRLDPVGKVNVTDNEGSFQAFLMDLKA